MLWLELSDMSLDQDEMPRRSSALWRSGECSRACLVGSVA